MRRIVLTIIGLVVALVHISAQDDPQYRMEIGAGVGMVSYEGDFNGNVLKNMQPMASLLWRYNFDPYKRLAPERQLWKTERIVGGCQDLLSGLCRVNL